MKLMLGDCLEKMKEIPDKSVDMVLTDPPYGTTACKWDMVIPFKEMWQELKRIVKNEKSSVLLFGNEPFSSALRMSNIKNFKYDWYLDKTNISGYLNAKKQPLRKVEIVSVFNSTSYYPQGLEYVGKIKKRGSPAKTNNSHGTENFQEFTNYPRNLIEFKRETEIVHPTQKPVSLLEYLIKTYTLEGQTVLDFTMGSGSTGVACVNTNRKFIGIEKDKKYFEIAKQRILKGEAK